MVMKTLEDEWYIVIKAYKFPAFEILRIIIYVLCVCTIITYTVCQLYDILCILLPNDQTSDLVVNTGCCTISSGAAHLIDTIVRDGLRGLV